MCAWNAASWTAIATVVIAFATAGAAAGSFMAASATRRTTEAQLFAQLMAEYAAPAMSDALRALRTQEQSWRNDPEKRSFEQVIGIWTNAFAGADADNRINNARRLVSSFFWKATALVKAGLLTGSLKEEILALAGKDVMFDVVIAMEEALATKLGRVGDAQRLIASFRSVFRHS